jgi:hypothetical protein
MAPRQARAHHCCLASPHLLCAGWGGLVLGRARSQPRPGTCSNEQGLDFQAGARALLPPRQPARTHGCVRGGGSMLGVHITALHRWTRCSKEPGLASTECQCQHRMPASTECVPGGRLGERDGMRGGKPHTLADHKAAVPLQASLTSVGRQDLEDSWPIRMSFWLSHTPVFFAILRCSHTPEG